MNLCGSCHGVDTVTHARNTPKGWKQTVDDMFARGAAGSDDEAGLIVNYLARNFGQKVNVNKASEKELQDGLALAPAEAQAIVKARPFKALDEVLKVSGVNAEKLREASTNIVF